MSEAEAQVQARLSAIEALAEVYTYGGGGGGTPRHSGYYGTFLEKLLCVVYGAAKDFGMKPIAFYLVSHTAPLHQELTGINAVSEVPSLRGPQAIAHFLGAAQELLRLSQDENYEGINL